MKPDITIEDLLNSRSFNRFINNQSTPKEREIWASWIEEKPENKVLYNEAKFLLTEFKINSEIITDNDRDWGNLALRMKQEESHKSKSASIFNLVLARFTPAMRYAAAILLIIVSAHEIWLFHNQRKYSVKKIASVEIENTAYNEFKTISFQNGSKIILAPHTKLIHNVNWLKSSTKKVRLDGQAYFDIRGGKSRIPKFQITTKQGVIRDFGTKFNVSTFNHKTTVVLEKGIVSISQNNTIANHSSVYLKPGQMAVISNKYNKKIYVHSVDTRIYTSWRNKVFYFDKTPLKTFISDIKNFYGIKVVVQDSALLKKKRLAGGITIGKLSNMLKVVSHVLNINMVIKNDSVFVANLNKK